MVFLCIIIMILCRNFTDESASVLYNMQLDYWFDPEGVLSMGYRWKNKIDVDEAVVTIMNTLDKDESMPNWLIKTINQSIKDSDPDMGTYFFMELKKHAPLGIRYFEDDY